MSARCRVVVLTFNCENIIAETLAQARKRANDGTLRVLRVKVKRGQTRKLPGAFIGNKGRTVFERISGTTMPSRSKYRGTHAEKIKPVQTIDVAQMFNTRRINAAVVRAIERRLPTIFAREVQFLLQRQSAKP